MIEIEWHDDAIVERDQSRRRCGTIAIVLPRKAEKRIVLERLAEVGCVRIGKRLGPVAARRIAEGGLSFEQERGRLAAGKRRGRHEFHLQLRSGVIDAQSSLKARPSTDLNGACGVHPGAGSRIGWLSKSHGGQWKRYSQDEVFFSVLPQAYSSLRRAHGTKLDRLAGPDAAIHLPTTRVQFDERRALGAHHSAGGPLSRGPRRLQRRTCGGLGGHLYEDGLTTAQLVHEWKSSSFAPAFNFSRSQTGCASRPAHVFPDLSRYLIGAFRPLGELARDLTSLPSIESWLCNC